MGLLLLMGDSGYDVRSELFGAGEVGAWYDPSDFSTMWQDAAGDTPVTAAGDVVGLILDKSRSGPSMGSNQATNGTFDKDEDWTKGTGWSIGSGVATKTAGSASVLSQAQTMTAGRYYIVTYTITRTAGSITPQFAGGTTVSGTARSTSGTFTDIMTVVSGNNTLQLSADASFAGTVDNVSLKELSAGNHAYQTTSSARPTLARIPSSGRRNVMVRSEEFDNASWARTAVGVTANTATSPWAASATADLIVEDSATSAHSISQTVSLISGVTYTLSLWAKTSGRNLQIVLASGFVNQGYVNFDLTSGEVGNKSLGTTATINAYSGGWYFCTVTFTSASTTSAGINIGLITSKSAARAESYLGDSTSGVIVDRAQLETGSSATNYQRVTSTHDVTEAGQPDCWYLDTTGSKWMQTNAIDFNTWTQDTRRNLLTDTESFGFPTWIKQESTVTENSAASPLSSEVSADLLIPSTNSADTHRITQAITLVNGQSYTLSVYAKSDGTYNAVRLSIDSPITIANFDLQNGVASGGSIESVGNGWYRCSLTFTANTTSTFTRIGVWDTYAKALASTAYAGNGTNGILILGAQLELGTLTTYQRVGTDEMTVIAGVRKLSDAASGTIVELSTGFNTNTNSMGVYSGLASGPGAAYVNTSRGNANAVAGHSANTATSFVSPISNVVTSASDISNDIASLRVNGTASGTNGTSDQGSGNYGNYAFYIGSRAGSSVFFGGHLFHLIIRGKTTEGSKLTGAEKLTARKTGITL